VTPQQETALQHPCRTAADRADPLFRLALGAGSTLVLTVDADPGLPDDDYGGPVWHASVVSDFGEPGS
jgi:hypothetical protein